jgi:hypothetical protein
MLYQLALQIMDYNRGYEPKINTSFFNERTERRHTIL